MSIELLPPRGTYIHTGLVIGRDSEAAKEISDKFAAQGMSASGGTGFGAQLTFGQDLAALSVGREGNTRLVASAEASVGVLHQSDDVTTGYRTAYAVNVRETERYWNNEQERWEYRTNDYSRSFWNYEDAYNYSYWKNTESDYYHDTYASYPIEYQARLAAEESATKGSLRVGGAIGVDHRFNEDWSLRVAGIGGVDIMRRNTPYVGGRVSVTADRLGGFVQVDQMVGGMLAGDTRTSLGVTGKF